jgi:hypothetical protein
VLVLSVVVTFLGIGLLRLLAAKSVGLMLTLVVGVSVDLLAARGGRHRLADDGHPPTATS